MTSCIKFRQAIDEADGYHEEQEQKEEHHGDNQFPDSDLHKWNRKITPIHISRLGCPLC